MSPPDSPKQEYRNDANSHESVVEDTPTPGIPENYKEEKETLEQQKSIPVGGKLQHFWQAWKALGASKKVVRWCRKGYMLPFIPGGEQEARTLCKQVCPPEAQISYKSNKEKQKALEEMMVTLLDKDVIERVPEGMFCFHNIVFLRPKPNGTWRLILDVSKLNAFLNVKKFTMETADVIKRAVEEDSWATSVDFSDAFHHLPIHKHFRPFLAFQVDGVRYMYKACPFGLSPIPQVFTELCTPVKIFARERWQCSVFQYLDDWLFISPSEDRTNQVTKLFVRLCLTLGLTVNLEKSHLQASRRLVHLGVLWDFKDACVSTPQDKIEAITKVAAQMSNTRATPLPLAESLMGKMVSVEKQVQFGRFHYRKFQAELLAELRHGRAMRWIRLSDLAKADLRWWSKQEHLSTWVRCQLSPPDTVIHTDASKHGWGASGDNFALRGSWSASESRSHINVLEMRAVEELLLRRAESLRESVLLLRIDNLSVVYYLNKQGGTRSANLMQVTDRVLSLAETHNIQIRAVHVRGELNVLADMLSRTHTVLRTEWRLAREAFEWIQADSPWGPATVDLFANRLNTQLDRFFSPCEDSAAIATDALVAEWPDEVLYAFPPTTLMTRVCEKILLERPRCLILLAPSLPTTPWYNTLYRHSLRVSTVPDTMMSLSQPHTGVLHPDPTLLSLVVWFITFRD
jgi:hypothetical protein